MNQTPCCEKCRNVCESQCPQCGYYCTCGNKGDCKCHTSQTPEDWREQIINLGVEVDTIQDGDARYQTFTFNEAQLESLLTETTKRERERITDMIKSAKLDKVPHDLKINPTVWLFADHIVEHTKSHLLKALNPK